MNDDYVSPARLLTIPALDQLQQYNVNRAGQLEGIRQSIYDFQTYSLAGQTELNFFQIPVGQSSKTLADTNMETAGSLPNPKNFLILGIEIYFWPGQQLSNGPAAAAAAEQVNDVYDVMKSGWVELFIGSKTYVQEAPIGRFPPKTGMILSSSQANASTAAAAQHTMTAYANMGGEPWEMKPPILLTPTQNFKVSLKWPTPVPIAVNGRIGVVMEGILYRLSQ